jgi:hypothetical protein
MEPLITNMDSEVEKPTINPEAQVEIHMIGYTVEKEFFKEYEHSILDMSVVRYDRAEGKSDTELQIRFDSKQTNVFFNVQAFKSDSMYMIEHGWQNPYESKSNYYYAEQYPDADRLVSMLQIKFETHILKPAQKPEKERGTTYYDAEAANEAIDFLKAYLDAE